MAFVPLVTGAESILHFRILVLPVITNPRLPLRALALVCRVLLVDIVKPQVLVITRRHVWLDITARVVHM